MVNAGHRRTEIRTGSCALTAWKTPRWHRDRRSSLVPQIVHLISECAYCRHRFWIWVHLQPHLVLIRMRSILGAKMVCHPAFGGFGTSVSGALV